MEEGREQKVHPCPRSDCKAVFNRPHRLSDHLMVHLNAKAYPCPVDNCNKSYTNKSHLNRHINTAHRSQEESINMMYSCEVCSKEFVTITDMKKHRRFHKTYECSDCQKKFTAWAEFQAHKLNDHKVDEFVCHECGASFKLRCYLVRHIKIHSYTKTYPCPYAECTRYYTRNSNLKQHIMVNHLQFTFDCTICNARLSTKAKLDYHMRLHNEPRREKAKPKTKATGRKPRSDKGITRPMTSTAEKIAGLPEALVEVCMDGVKSSVAEKIAGLPEALVEVCMEEISRPTTSNDEKLTGLPESLVEVCMD